VLAGLLISGSAKANAPAMLPDPSWTEEIPSPEIVNDVNANTRETSTEANVSVPADTGVAHLLSKDEQFASAYFGTLSILADKNECSDFFGGPASAADVFAELMRNVRKDSLPATIAMNMSGETTEVNNHRTKSRYRLFGRVVINSRGPFFRYRAPYSATLPTRLGSFQADTNEGRVLMFLHELGHAIKGDDGNWLLPNDGSNSDLSRRNSEKIEDVCGKQIKALRHSNVTQDVQLASTRDSKNDQ
jgi:hypothetical protein